MSSDLHTMRNVLRCLAPAVLLAFPLCCARSGLAQPAPERSILRGHVSSHSGQPVSGATVIVRRSERTGNYAFWGVAVVADARGDFSIVGVEEGDYELGGESAGLAAAADAFVAYHFGPGSPPAQLTQTVPLQLALQVLAPDGTRLDGQKLMLHTRQKLSSGETHGRYESADNPERPLHLTLNHGASLFVSCFALGWGFIDLRDLPEGSHLERTLTLQAGSTLRLSAVEAETGQPIAGAVSNIYVPLRGDFEKAGISEEIAKSEGGLGAMGGIDGIGNLFHGAARDLKMKTGADGALVIPNLRPGFYSVNLQCEGFDEAAFQMVHIVADQEAACVFKLPRQSPENAASER